MSKISIPDQRNIHLKNNIVRLMNMNGGLSTRKLSDMTAGAVSQSMIAQFLKRPEEFQLSIRVIRAIAEAFGVAEWMLIVPNFPFDAVGISPLRSISHQGYQLLKTFEELPGEKKTGILDYVLFQLRENQQASSRIREGRLKYKPCDETFE